MKKEHQTAANAVWMMCNNDDVKKYIKENKDYYNAIVKLADTSVIDELRVSCKGILMLINDGNL